jgi:inner membrane protein
MIFITRLGFGILVGFYFHSATGIVLSATGSVLPDIDIPISKISRYTLNTRGKKLANRGITHCLFTHVLIYVIYYLLFRNYLILPFIIGYISHIFLDLFNPKGVKLLLPFTDHSFTFPLTFKAGSKYDYLLCFFFFALAIVSILKGF